MSFLRQISRGAIMCALLAGAFAAPAVADDVTVIQFSSVGGITDASLYIAEEYGLFAKATLDRFEEMPERAAAPQSEVA